MWHVIDTPMYPARWHVVKRGGTPNNATCHFFRDNADAWKEANRRNERDKEKTNVD